MSSISCNWEEFKQMAKEFHFAAPTMNRDELENSFKCLGLGYLGMYEEMWRHSAAALLRIESRVYMQREMELS